VTRHFLYFAVRSSRNRLARQLRRLRTPRYAIAAVAGLAYFYLIFGGWRAPSAGEQALGAQYLAAGRAVGPLFLGLLAAWWWLWGGHRRGLVLTPAETHLLVPAPVLRRDIVRFKIVQAQLPILFSALLGTVITRATVLPWPLRFLSIWLMLATLHQHQIAASLVHAAAEEQGRGALRRHRVPLLLFSLALLAVAAAVVRAVLEIRAAPSVKFALGRLADVVTEPVPRIALAPFRLLLDPLLATSFDAWLPAFLIALAVLGGHYLWLQRTDAAFEEAAALQGEQAAARLAAVRSGGLSRLRFSRLDRPARLARPLLPLLPLGRPAYAVFWKNIVYMQRAIRPLAVIIAVALVLVMAGPAVMSSDAPQQALHRVGSLLLLLSGAVLVMAPMAVRNDLRMDLRHLEALRTYPLRGRDVVAAEIGAAALTILAVQLPLAVMGVITLAAAGTLSVGFGLLALLLAVAVLPPLCALAVTIQNAIALLYPGWVRLGDHGSGGMEAIGQNLLTLAGSLLLLVLCAIPPLLVAAAVGGPLVLLSTTLALPAALLAAAAAVSAEVWFLFRWLGAVYDRTDPVAAGLLR
jgi:ABC-2 type transport system permease protein